MMPKVSGAELLRAEAEVEAIRAAAEQRVAAAEARAASKADRDVSIGQVRQGRTGHPAGNRPARRPPSKPSPKSREAGSL
jgi:hypothetical protein